MYLESSQILLCIVFACALVIFIIILFLYSKGQQYEQYFKLQQSSERERIRIVEKERNRVAVELHDNICMQLLTVGMNLEVIEPDRQEHHSVLTSTKQHLGKLIDDLRKISYEMRPVGVELKGPLYAFEDYVLNRLGNTSLEIDVTPADCSGLTEEQSLQVYRMLQEMLQNALKHSGGTHFQVQGRREGRELWIQASDDGVGYDTESLKSNTGVGLYNLATRAQVIGARLTTYAAPGKGVRHEIRITL